jgi:hypothetical protein
MNWFKSIWFKIRKSNGLPTNNVLIPIQEKIDPIVDIDLPKPKRKRVSKTKEVKVIIK